ncbi:MAG: HAMP domain-containing histidine kinase [Betaproteobacteria bacterium]|nr:HAMP domain-containing histidine kinase [Betaproteobacteria bacterium]
MEGVRLSVPRLGLAAFRGRLIVRGAFLLLIVATLALAVGVLKEEKQRSFQNYQQGFQKTRAELAAKLRHPAGQLALLNAGNSQLTAPPLHPLVLPYAALDFDDQFKAQQAVELAGCVVQYADGGSICVAVGNNPYAGGFIYLVGSFTSGELVGRGRGELELATFHYARVTLDMRGQTSRWVAPYEALEATRSNTARGRLTGFVDEGDRLQPLARPVRDFRGWLWQNGPCVDGAGSADDTPGCQRRAFFSIRLPVAVFSEDLFQKPRPLWPPRDLDQIRVRLEVVGPGQGKPLFDSNAPGVTPPLSLNDLGLTLSAGEVLHIRKLGGDARDALTIKGHQDREAGFSPWLAGLIRRLPVEGFPPGLSAKDVIVTPEGRYEMHLVGDVGGVEEALSVVATRVSWFVAAMLAAIALTWFFVEIGLIHRVAVLTRRAAAVSHKVAGTELESRLAAIDLSDLRGRDEIGILAGSLADLLQRVRDAMQREQIRAQQERDMWQAVGHEIMSPLQSLMVLHGESDDASHRYVQRMQQAVRVLYGAASPSEALAAATLQVATLDANAFLRQIADNAHFAGIQGVVYASMAVPVMVRADAFSLEDVVTHILKNADRHRTPNTPIVLTLTVEASSVSVEIRNQGPTIDLRLIDKIFEYGVSDPALADSSEHRGQGLFVAKTYMAKMGGTIQVQNQADGVSFTLTLQGAGH